MDQATVEHYKAVLVEMRARLTHEVTDIENAIPESVTPPGDVSTVPTHLANLDASDVDRNVEMARNEAGILGQVEAALERIEAGTFGRCENCGRQIARSRLDALPYTSLCIDCARREEEAGTEGAMFEGEETR